MKGKKSTFLIAIIVTIVVIITLVIGFSYSFVYRNKLLTNTFKITTSNLASTVTYNSVEGNLNIMSDEDGVNQAEYGIVTISKENEYSVFYNISLGYLLSSLPSGKTASDLVPLEYVKVALFPVNGNVVSSNPVVGPVSIASMPITSLGILNNYDDMFSIYYNLFNPSAQSVSYALKVWLDEDTPQEFSNHYVYLALDVTQQTKVSMAYYNISGTVKNSSGSVLTSGTVYLQNGNINCASSNYSPCKAAISSNGSYTLYNVPTGTYNLSVVNGSNLYETTIHVNETDSISISQTSPGSGTSGDNIKAKAFQNYTTVQKILDNNSLSTNSNEATISSYVIPNSYIINGDTSLEATTISNVYLTCSEGKIIVSK